MRLRSGLSALVIIGVVVLGGCGWRMPGEGPDRRSWNALETAITPANVGGITAGWTASADEFARNVVSDSGVVYQTDSSGLRALDAATGQLHWSNDALEGIGPIVRTSTLLSTGSGTSCFLQTRARADGGDPHSVLFGGIPLVGVGFTNCGIQQPLEVGTTVVVAHGASALDLKSPSCSGQRGYTSVRDLTAFDETLAVKWSHEVVLKSGCDIPDSSFPGPQFGDIASDGSLVFAVIPELGTVQAFPLACATPCAPTWTRQLPHELVGSPVVLTDGRGVAVSDTTGVVSVLDAGGGTVKWSSASGAGVRGLAATNTALFASRANGQLSVYASADCGQPTCPAIWTATIGHTPLATAPSVGGDVLWVPGTDSSVVAYDARGCGAATCSSLKTLTTTTEVRASPIIVSGRVIVPTAGGIETFALPG